MSTRILIALSVLQTIGIIALIARTNDDPEPVAQQHSQSVLTLATSQQAKHDLLPADEARLRGIIREELTRVLQSNPNQSGSAASVVPTRPRNEAKDRQQQDLVAQQIETYRSVGSITDQQMEALQRQIAQLDEASRGQMMSRLIKALNSGDIKGRL